jgi:Tol biopolymer transport system component
MRIYRWLGAAFVLLGSALLAADGWPAASQAQSTERCFSETGYCINGPIREYWEQNDGLRVFGLPIGPQQEEYIEGRPIQVQWFERNRLELHLENDPPYHVLLGRLGVDVLEARGRNWFTFARDEGPQPGCRFFDTGFNVCGDFLAAWQANGLDLGDPGISAAESLALFGQPISQPQPETLSNGQTYTVQWFERARFEMHPENAPPYNVLFGLLGNTLQPPNAPTPPGRIAFLTGTDNTELLGNAIYTMNPDGTDRRQQTQAVRSSPDDEWFLILGYEWARAANRFAFSATNVWDCGSRGCRSRPNIYTVERGGTSQMQLTEDGQGPWEVALSPDGEQVAFAGETGLIVMNADGTEQRNMTANQPNLRYIQDPTWAPDSRRVAFIAAPGSGRSASDMRVYVAAADGSGITQVYNKPVSNIGLLAWSPDGTQLAINPDVNMGTLVAINADGSGERTIIQRDYLTYGPFWSPDGTRLLFYGQGIDPESNAVRFGVYTIQADGRGLQRLVSGFQNINSAAWSPDGRRIVLAGREEQTGVSGIYLTSEHLIFIKEPILSGSEPGQQLTSVQWRQVE